MTLTTSRLPPPSFDEAVRDRIAALTDTLSILPDDVRHRILHLLSSWDLCTEVRLLNTRWNLASIAVLHERYLDSYLRLVRPPYTADPLCTSTMGGLGAETKVLNLFCAHCAHLERLSNESPLHLLVESVTGDSPDWLQDLFSFRQPTARLEDLVGHFMASQHVTRVRPEHISIRLSRRQVALSVPFASASSRSGTYRKQVLTVDRDQSDSLETLAAKLTAALESLAVEEHSMGAYHQIGNRNERM